MFLNMLNVGFEEILSMLNLGTILGGNTTVVSNVSDCYAEFNSTQFKSIYFLVASPNTSAT